MCLLLDLKNTYFRMETRFVYVFSYQRRLNMWDPVDVESVDEIYILREHVLPTSMIIP